MRRVTGRTIAVYIVALIAAVAGSTIIIATYGMGVWLAVIVLANILGWGITSYRRRTAPGSGHDRHQP